MSCQKVVTLTKYKDWTKWHDRIEFSCTKIKLVESGHFIAVDRMLVKPVYNLGLLLIRRVVGSL